MAVPLLLAGLVFSVAHVPPFGPLGNLLPLIAVWQFLVYRRQTVAVSAPAAVPA